MNNAELFKMVFGIYAEEFWSYPKDKMLDWLDYDASTADVVEVVRCKDCLMHGVCRFERGLGLDGYCSQCERREDNGKKIH